MEFNPVNGFDISRDFFENGKCCVEPEIEASFCFYIRQLSQYIKVRKTELSGGRTDGIIKIYDEKGNYLGFIINESKRDQVFDEIRDEGTGLAQAMFYAGNFLYDVSFDSELTSEKFLGIFITNAYNLLFIPKKNLTKQIETFEPLWNKYSYNTSPNVFAKSIPAKIWTSENKPKYQRYYLDKDFRLDLLFKDIYEYNY
jgi:hypothetical protein